MSSRRAPGAQPVRHTEDDAMSQLILARDIGGTQLWL